jgi:hypothetical protein
MNNAPKVLLPSAGTLLAFMLATFPTSGLADQLPLQTQAPIPVVTYPDGAVATAQTACGIGDLCGTIKLPDGDELSFYNIAGGRCQPYVLRMVRAKGDTVLFASYLTTDKRGGAVVLSGSSTSAGAGYPTYSTFVGGRGCIRFRNTAFTLDNGQVKMGVFLARSGALFVRFMGP